MEIERQAEALSEIERKTLKVLADGKEKGVRELADESRLDEDSVRRAVGWLSEKKLIELRENREEMLALTFKGKEAFEKGLPEQRMLHGLHQLGSKAGFEEVMKKSGLKKAEFNAALGKNKRKAFVFVVKEKQPVIELTEVGVEFLEKTPEEKIVLDAIENKQLSAETGEEKEKKIIKELMERGLAEKKEKIERSASISAGGKKALSFLEKSSGKRAYNIHDPAPTIFIGKKQPYIQFLQQIRRKLTELGFKEMESRLIELEFYNFDVLFQPQNHPARSWTDTYQLKELKKGMLPDKKIVKLIKDAHEFGGKTGSRGWGYDWSAGIASRLMPAAHGTAASARQLVKGIEVPGKYFAVARCYRPDVIDATHLSEFNQMEGFIVDKSFNFRHLLGMLKQFAVEIAGAEEVKFYPDYYPFTEPSVQLSAKHPQLGWIEFGGAGIFRPEMTEQLGIEGKCLAWGLGIDRLAMFKLGIKDIRHLFSSSLEWLREEPLVEVE